jgi:hypothetical protein
MATTRTFVAVVMTEYSGDNQDWKLITKLQLELVTRTSSRPGKLLLHLFCPLGVFFNLRHRLSLLTCFLPYGV